LKPASASRRLLWPLRVLYSMAAPRAGVVLRARHLPKKKVAGNSHQRRQPHRRRHGQNTVGSCGVRSGWPQKGKTTAILTRGYRGRRQWARMASRRVTKWRLLRERLPEKYKLAWAPIATKMARSWRGMEPNGLFLDDGFQHLRLARDVDVVLIDATDPFGSGLVLLPAGRLREPFQQSGAPTLW